jgi:PAS domain S-box-containing protein
MSSRGVGGGEADGDGGVPGSLAVGWRDVFDSAPTAISVVDPHGRLLAGNRAFCELLGYRPDDIGLIDAGTLSRPEDHQWVSGYLARLATGEIDYYDTVKQFVRDDGGQVTARLRARALRGDDGRCRAIVATLTPTEARSGVDDARLRRLLAHTKSTFALLDADGAVIDTSGTYQSLGGYPSEFWAERNVVDLLAADSEGVALAFHQELLDHPGEARTVELHVRAADGSNQLLEIQAVNLLADPEVSGIVVSAHNVTEQRRALQELEARQGMAEFVAEARTNLLATVSHELRNPLHAVQGVAELLAAEPLSPRAADLALTLAQQLDSLGDVTEDLLDTARLDAGSVELHEAPCDLGALVAEMVDYGRAMAGERQVSVVADIAPGAPEWVLADRSRLRQVLRNLVHNAVKFTAQGSVAIGVAPMVSGVSLTVSDTGVGIPDGERDAVLEPFRTGSSAGELRGSGLGLAIVQRLAAAMGGTFDITSEVGRGTRARVEIPLAPTAAPTEPVVEPSGAPSDATMSAVSVLVVEDSPVNQRLACSQLEHLSMTATVADSGEAALDLFSRPEPPHVDVILMDQQLPGMSGTETAQRLRSLDAAIASIPIIALTASASPADRDVYLAAGLDGFIAKPARLADIRAAIEEVLTPERIAARHGTAPALRAPPALEWLDVGVLDHLVEDFGDASVVETLVQTFLAELPVRGNDLLAALRAGDEDLAVRAAHTLESTARLIGAAALADACESVERGTRVDVAALDELLGRTHSSAAAWLENQG